MASVLATRVTVHRYADVLRLVFTDESFALHETVSDVLIHNTLGEELEIILGDCMKFPSDLAAAAAEDRVKWRALRIRDEEAAAYRAMAPLLDRLQALVARRGWPLGKNILECAVMDLEQSTDAAEAKGEKG